MPASAEAEAAVLGSMMLDRDCIGDVVRILKAESFYRVENRILYETIVELYENKPPDTDIDAVLVRADLTKRGKLEDAGGADYILKLIGSVPTLANTKYYVDIVQEKHILRELIHASNDILSEACSEVGELSEKLDKAEEKIYAVTEKKSTGNAKQIKDLLIDALTAIDSRKGNTITGIPTGYEELDHLLSGLHEGEMIIVAGRPSMGKTSFAMNVAERIGVDSKIPVAIFSLEMSDVQLTERLLCSRAKVDSQLVRHGALDQNDYEELVTTCGELNEAPIFIDDTPGMTPLEIRAKARRLKSAHDIGCIVIDYLQLMSLGGRIDSRQQEISTISRYLKAMARELKVPVIVLSQLNRAAEQREDHKPRMSDLRESGSIEQDADVIILLHREDYYHRNDLEYEPDNRALVIIAKQRNGPTGAIELSFLGQYTRFEPINLHAVEPY
ncbi:Replicative DNA helicase [Limihaloglobus sulfuriphilus]|uniref:Replicative DNA helicase n=2 Tax=Limihaloglobus sulfuriphilus TaxID=1851148 RepID=A0A1Q2MBR4_9BACT|nr:Replicative DNA helicase [Limihaloglobus sulfuriphilus]